MVSISFAERFGATCTSALEVFCVHIGLELGFYSLLADKTDLNPRELASLASTNERLTREWLEQQAVAGVVAVKHQIGDGEDRRYFLPSEHADALLSVDSPNYVGYKTTLPLLTARLMPELLSSFRSGSGIPGAMFGELDRRAQELSTRGSYLRSIGHWLPFIADVHQRLIRDPPARIADIGCGAGWAAIAMATAYPRARVDGYDIEEESVAGARANASATGVADRVAFHVVSASSSSSNLPREYQLVTAFESLHEMGRPSEALRNIRSMLATDGNALVVETALPDQFTAPGSGLDRHVYAASVLCCLQAGLADGPSPTGAVLRRDVLRGLSLDAGFRELEVVPIADASRRFYLLRI
jgi:SAM-dependent methyltransferase